MKERTVQATIENIAIVTEFVEAQLEEIGCAKKAQMQIDIAIDEIFSNIARYAYESKEGTATIRVEVLFNPKTVVITFIDHGIPYNPLARKDPDITESLKEREIGGLGIFMVKQTMDELVYDYQNGKNILTMKKKLE